MALEKRKNIDTLLSFFDSKNYNIEEVSEIIYKVLNIVGQKDLGDHKAGCTWSIMMIYKKGKCNIDQLEELVDEFFEYVKGYDEYFESLSIWNNKEDTMICYYNKFVNKKL
jgi:hypothetical protein